LDEFEGRETNMKQYEAACKNAADAGSGGRSQRPRAQAAAMLLPGKEAATCTAALTIPLDQRSYGVCFARPLDGLLLVTNRMMAASKLVVECKIVRRRHKSSSGRLQTRQARDLENTRAGFDPRPWFRNRKAILQRQTWQSLATRPKNCVAVCVGAFEIEFRRFGGCCERLE